MQQHRRLDHWRQNSKSVPTRCTLKPGLIPASAQHSVSSSAGRVSGGGPAGGVPGVLGLHLHHQLLHPATVPRRSFQLTFTSFHSAHNPPSQLSITLPTSCFLLQSPPTTRSYSCVYQLYFSLIISSESRRLLLSVMGKLTVYRIGEDDWSKLSENDQLTTCSWTDYTSCFSPTSLSSVSVGSPEDQQEVFQVFWGSTFTISCSIQPQYPGGSFQLTFTSSNSAHNSTQPAVNHSAHFLFPAAEPAHQGSYSCVYHLYVFSHNFSSESRVLSLSVMGVPSDPRSLIIRAILLPLILLVENIVLYFYCRARREQLPRRQENIEPDYYNLGVPAAEGGPTEEEGAQGAE
ncbi:hypothetical protein PFLUV_G00077750 [Perca fluviatilis]|uniref:Immunoglobulin-like beta-sandwich domain-containing protein n=1 Tax=Perca fluviatilis TaxID=8168 RepID=A0A6A5FLB0_PERFL|nr:hypothetical protein PFLUV_G00077750 [Perca fluviatilis]